MAFTGRRASCHESPASDDARGYSRCRGLVFYAAWLSATLASSPVRADLFGDADALSDRLAAHYVVRRVGARVLERGESLSLATDIADLVPARPGCMTAIVIGSVRSAFALRLGTQSGSLTQAGPSWESDSIAGLASITRCGSRRRDLLDVTIEMRSHRAAVERLLVESDVPLPPAFRYLPSREPGPPELEPQEPVQHPGIPARERVDLARRSLTAAGASATEDLAFDASPSGAGDVALRFEPGCYRLRLFAEDQSVDRHLVAELSWPDGDGPVSGDRLATRDIELRACVVRRTVARLRFVGAGPGQSVLALRARFPLPRRFLPHWGAEGAAALALAIHEYQAAPLEGVPVFDSLGSGGATMLHVATVPGACYVAAVAPLREMSAPLVLAAEVGADHRQNSSPFQGVGTALAFCAGGATTVALEVESSPRESMWLLGVWQVGADSVERPNE